jgi:glycine/D-amino acid oxidase-like deaminating enzyme
MPAAISNLWEATAPPAPETSALSGPTDTEVAIVGAGYTGLSTALHLAERGVAVTLLEASTLGAGGSGRSGGQVIPGIRHFPDELVAAYGAEVGHRLHAFGAGDADATFALIERRGIACDGHCGGWIQAADTETALAEGKKRAQAWIARGAPVDLLDRHAFVAATGSTAYLGGWRDARGGTVNPMAYTRGLAAAAMGAGARVHTKSPVTAVDRDGAGWRLVTPGGHVNARRILIAANLAKLGLLPDVARAQLGVWSYQVATRPLSNEERRIVLSGSPAVSDTRRVLRYFRLDTAGRLVIGGKGKAGPPAGEGDFALQRHMLDALYPALGGIPLDHAWGGEIGITLDQLPRFFSLGHGAWAILQDDGKGIAWCTASGAPLADLLTGAEVSCLPLLPPTAPRPIPFHGLRRLYVAMGNAWYRMRDRMDGARGSYSAAWSRHDSAAFLKRKLRVFDG